MMTVRWKMTETKLGCHLWGQLLTLSLSPGKQPHYFHEMPPTNATRMLTSALSLGPGWSGKSRLCTMVVNRWSWWWSQCFCLSKDTVSQRSQCHLNSLHFPKWEGGLSGSCLPTHMEASSLLLWSCIKAAYCWLNPILWSLVAPCHSLGGWDSSLIIFFKKASSGISKGLWMAGLLNHTAFRPWGGSKSIWVVLNYLPTRAQVPRRHESTDTEIGPIRIYWIHKWMDEWVSEKSPKDSLEFYLFSERWPPSIIPGLLTMEGKLLQED